MTSAVGRLPRVSSSQRVAPMPGPLSGPADDVSVSPSAVRLRWSRWRDPRLWVGVLLVLGSLLLGAKVLAAADDTTAVWQLRTDLPAGAPLTTSDLEMTRVHFASDGAQERYVAAAEAPPAGALLTHEVAAGELLARSALGSEGTDARLRLPLNVATGGVPSGLSAADHVDVWAVPAADSGRGPTVVLSDVTVTAVDAVGPGGSGAERGATVAVPADADIASALRRLSGASVVLVLIGD